jgi:arylsulfatase A-like enzyme
MKLSIYILFITVTFTLFSYGDRKPNILFIMADDLGYSDTTPYGNQFHETPNIQRIADKGVTLKNFHSTSPVCSPSRASFMTGLYTERLGMTQPACHIKTVVLDAYVRERAWPHFKLKTPISTTRLDTKFTTYAKALKDNGYYTAHYGKWHLGHAPYTPLEHGFDVDVPHTKSHGPIGSYFGPKKYSDSFTLRKGEHLEDRMAQEAVAFIHENKDRPFLLNYWAFSVHSPYFAKKQILEKYREKAKTLPADAIHRNPIHAAMVETFDTNVGLLLDALEDAGIAEETIVVLTSDNGGTIRSAYTEEKYWGNGNIDEMVRMDITNNFPYKNGKGTIYDGGTAVPCLIFWPGKMKPGSVNKSLFSGADMFPTFVEMIGGEIPNGLTLDGVSQVPALLGQREVRKTLHGFWPVYIPREPDTVPSAWIRKGNYKLTRFFFDNVDRTHRHTLNDIKSDIGEKINLASQYPEKVQELSHLMDIHFKETRAVLPEINEAHDPNVIMPVK